MTAASLAIELRVLLIVLCFVGIVAMIMGFIKYRKLWNEKTRDYWFGRIMWCIAGMSAGIEGIVRHRPISYSIVFFIFAAAVTLKGALQKGSWGTPKQPAEEEKPNRLKKYTG